MDALRAVGATNKEIGQVIREGVSHPKQSDGIVFCRSSKDIGCWDSNSIQKGDWGGNSKMVDKVKEEEDKAPPSEQAKTDGRRTTMMITSILSSKTLLDFHRFHNFNPLCFSLMITKKHSISPFPRIQVPSTSSFQFLRFSWHFYFKNFWRIEFENYFWMKMFIHVWLLTYTQIFFELKWTDFLLQERILLSECWRTCFYSLCIPISFWKDPCEFRGKIPSKNLKCHLFLKRESEANFVSNNNSK